jgi:hypothetical protein
MRDCLQVGATVAKSTQPANQPNHWSTNHVCSSDSCKKHEEKHDKATVWLVHADSSRTALDDSQTDCGPGTCVVMKESVAEWEPCLHRDEWKEGGREEIKDRKYMIAGEVECVPKEEMNNLHENHCAKVTGDDLKTKAACEAETSLVWQTSPLTPGELVGFKPLKMPVCTYTPPKLAAGLRALDALPRAVVKMSQERKRVPKFEDLVEKEIIDKTTGQFLNLAGELGLLPLRYYQKQCGHPQDYSNYCDEDDSVETVGPLTPEESKQACENDACTALPRPTFPFGLVVRVTHKHAYTQATRQAHTLTHEHTVSQSPL